MSAVKQYLVSQFGHPRGALGRVAGWIMANRASNRQRNAWTVDLLDLAPASRVLEIGCGPGLALARLAERCTSGVVVGLDRSSTMLAQATRRNHAAVVAGRVVLAQGDVERDADGVAGLGPFDAIVAVNVAMFFADPSATLRRLYDLMADGGRIALTQQPRFRGATNADARERGERLATALAEVGFRDARVEMLDIEPVAAACALAAR